MNRQISIKELKDLGFKHLYDSEIEEPNTPDEFSYSVYHIDLGNTYLDATIEYGRYKKYRHTHYVLGEDIELCGRDLTKSDIELLKEIIISKN